MDTPLDRREASSTERDLAFTGWVSALARAHARALLAVARKEGLRAEDALDAVQQGFVTLLGLPQARALAHEDADARALMSVIVRNAARNLRRRHHRARPHASLDDHDGAELSDPLPHVDDLVWRAEQHVRLRGCVDRLGEVQKRIVTLRVLEDVSASEVAESLGLRSGHVAVLLHRGKRELLRCMTDR